jgi:hypothetical protein
VGGPQNPGRAENICFSPYSKTPEHHPMVEKKKGKTNTELSKEPQSKMEKMKRKTQL